MCDISDGGNPARTTAAGSVGMPAKADAALDAESSAAQPAACLVTVKKPTAMPIMLQSVAVTPTAAAVACQAAVEQGVDHPQEGLMTQVWS
jgi:hypothetical protein